MLSNPERKRHYDKYGTVADDEEGEEAFFREFEEMFFGGSMFGAADEMDDFMEFLESDTKFMKNMFKGLGKNARVGGRKGAAKRGGRGGGADGMEEMLAFMMMPGMMGMGMKMSGGMFGGGASSKSKKSKKKK